MSFFCNISFSIFCTFNHFTHSYIIYLSDPFSMISRSGSLSCFFCLLIPIYGKIMRIRDLGKISLLCHHSACISTLPVCLIAYRLELSFPRRKNSSVVSGGFSSLGWTYVVMFRGEGDTRHTFFHVLKVTLLFSPPTAYFLQIY